MEAPERKEPSWHLPPHPPVAEGTAGDDARREPAAPGDGGRLVAWAHEMTVVHDRLRRAVALARESVAQDGPVEVALADPLLYCWGSCTALAGHHDGEDARLFPVVVAEHPELAGVVERLQEDHHMVELLLAELRRVLAEGAPRPVLLSHLDGLAAIMDSHFGYEERTLLPVLQRLRLDAPAADVLGPLADG